MYIQDLTGHLLRPPAPPVDDDGGAIRLTSVLVATLFIIALFSPGRVPDPSEAARSILRAAVYGLIPISTLALVRSRPLRSILRLGAVLVIFSSLYPIVGMLQLALIPEWQDHRLLALDESLWGAEVSTLLLPLRNPVLSEFLMYSYVAYVPALFLTGMFCLIGSGSRALEVYTNLLARTFIVCYAGFLLFPVASQGFIDPANFGGPLSGGFFTSLAESLRSDVHFPGGSLPSAHCAAATIMLISLWRHNRRAFWVSVPTLAPIYVATVYGQFHYVWDAVAGILAAISVACFSRISSIDHSDKEPMK